VVLGDIHTRIMNLRHQPGQSINMLIAQLMNDFVELEKAGEKLSERHHVGIILSCIADSPDFQQALWETNISVDTLV
jgi:hypothetical protein